jgi:hypothetical protein
MLSSVVILLQGSNDIVATHKVSLPIIKEILDHLHNYDEKGIITSVLIKGKKNIVETKSFTQNRIEEIFLNLQKENIEKSDFYCIIDFKKDILGMNKIMQQLEKKEESCLATC